MKKGLLLLACVLVISCVSTKPSSSIDVDAEFERLYSALEIENTIDSLFGLGVSYIDADKVVMVESDVKNNVTTNQREIAKKAFKQILISRLSPTELKNAADFYSTKQGLAAHKAIIDAEYAVSEVFNNN